MKTYKYGIKTLIVLIVFSFFSGLLLAQKALDHKLFLERIRHSSDNIYKECIKEYDAYLDKFPNDVSVLIEKCKFIQHAQRDENEYYNPNQEEFDRCAAALIDRFPTHPEVLLFQTTYLWGEELEKVFRNAEKTIRESPKTWSNTNLAALYKAMAKYYYYDADYNRALFCIERAIRMERAILNEFYLEYVRILLELDRREKALNVLISIPDTTKEKWQLVQKANLFLELKAYSKALDIYNLVEQMDSTYYINKPYLASTFEGVGEYELARKYLVADTSRSYGKKDAIIRLLHHDLKYQDGSKCIDSYNALRDLGYSSDPISFYRLKLFFSHPTQPWKLRDLSGILSLLVILVIFITIPYIWILPVYFAGKQYKFLSPKNVYESHWTLKMFWVVSTGYLFASLFAFVVEPGMLYSAFNSSYFDYDTDIVLENKGLQILVFIIIMALLGMMAMYKVNAKILLSSSYSIAKSILIALGIFLVYKLISAVYILIFNFPMSDLANASKILLASTQDFAAMVSTLGKVNSILLIGFLVPIYEEIIFRGVILDSCQRHVNFNVANIFQALLFSIVHLNLFLLPVFFLFGILTGILRKKSGGLLPCIVLHILNNVIAIIFIVTFIK